MPNIPWTRVSNYNNFTPATFIGCTLWLDAADSSSITTSSGNVTQWRDKSGNANHTTAGTGQPTYTAPFVVFGGSAQLILPLVFSTDWSIFVVAKTTQTTGTSGGQWFSGAGLFDAEISGILNDYGMNIVGGYLATGSGNPDTTIQSVSQVNNGNLFIGEYLRTSSTGLMSNIVTGGTAVTTTGPTGIRNSVSRISLGALQTNINYFIGSIAEVVAFNTVISVAQRIAIEGYLAQKWGFVASLPANHPGAKTNGPITINLPYSATFNPLSVAGCALWLDAADSSTVTGTAPITAWLDKSSAGRTVTITSGPTYGSTTRNGKNTMSFSNNVISSSIASAVGTGDFTLIAVWYQSSAGTNTVLSLGTVASSSQSLGYSGNKYNFYQYGSLESAYTTTPTWVVQVGTRISSVKKVYVTGTAGSVPASDSFNVTSTTVTIGKGDNFAITGEIGEIMVFTGTMSDTNRQLLESYLAQKWGIQSQLPSNHTYYTSPAGLPTSIFVQRATNKQTITVVSGMLLNLDAVSYTSGSTWTALTGNNYSITGTLTTNSYAVVFNGSSYAQDLTGITSSTMYSYTLDVWFYAAAGASGSVIGELGQPSLSPWSLTLISINSNTISVGFYSGAQYKLSVGSYSANTWTHVSYTYNDTTKVIIGYVNGVYVTSATVTKLWPTTVYLTAGGAAVPDTTFTGRIGAFKVYNSILTADQIKQNYNALAGRYGLGLI
jgi:hypothetical protein